MFSSDRNIRCQIRGRKSKDTDANCFCHIFCYILEILKKETEIILKYIHISMNIIKNDMKIKEVNEHIEELKKIYYNAIKIQECYLRNKDAKKQLVN